MSGTMEITTRTAIVLMVKNYSAVVCASGGTWKDLEEKRIFLIVMARLQPLSDFPIAALRDALVKLWVMTYNCHHIFAPFIWLCPLVGGHVESVSCSSSEVSMVDQWLLSHHIFDCPFGGYPVPSTIEYSEAHRVGKGRRSHSRTVGVPVGMDP